MENWNNSEELANEYANDLKPLKSLYRYFKERRDICLKLELECEEQGEWELAEGFKEDCIKYRNRMKEIQPIISNSEYAIKWLKNGVEPTREISITQLSYEQRTVYVSDVDQALMYLNTFQADYPKMGETDLERMNVVFSLMTTKQKDAFISVRGQGNTYERTAEFMGISVSSVRCHLSRAEEKIRKLLNK